MDIDGENCTYEEVLKKDWEMLGETYGLSREFYVYESYADG